MNTTEAPPRPAKFMRYLRETGLLIGRQLRTIPRNPERLSDVTIQPIIFTLLFLYVFGSAIHIPGIRYQDYLLPGLVAQSLAFGIIGSGVATANDFSSGVVDRFRSLPITRLSVLTAQVIGQSIEQVLGITITIAIGLILGWRPDFGFIAIAEFLGLLFLGIFTFAWFGVLIGLIAKNSDAVQGIGFAIVLPMSFLAGAFVPIEGMKLVPRTIGEWEPISAFVAAMRHITQGTQATGSWQLENPVVAMILWCALIVALCMPIALWRFKKLTVS